MKLYWSSRSPFVRKVMVTAHETGVADKLRTERVAVGSASANAELMEVNPLNKIPTLVLDDGTALHDSRVICEFFDSLNDGQKLFPTDPRPRWQALRRQALGDGLMELNVLRLGEQNRPAEARSDRHMSAFGLKTAKTLDLLEIEADRLAADAFGIGHIAIGCALSHLDFRFSADDWRAGRSTLAAWHAAFAQRPSARATEYVDTY
jgi:glutathione S-transferase